jgi:hypothetical protein
VVALRDHVTIPGRPLPVPVIVKARATHRREGRGTEEQIVVDRRGHRHRPMGFPNAEAALVDDAAHGGHLPEIARLHPRDRLGNREARAVLRVHLDDAVVFFRRRQDLPAFPQIVRDGFFVEHILAGLHRPDALQRVQMIGRRDRDRIDVSAREQFAEIDDGVRVIASGARHGELPVEIVHSNDGDADIAIGAGDLGPRAGGKNGGRGRESRGPEECAAADGVHAQRFFVTKRCEMTQKKTGRVSVCCRRGAHPANSPAG